MEKEDKLNPVNINEDVWFYQFPKTLEFVVWAEEDGKRIAKTFRVRKSTLKKYL